MSGILRRGLRYSVCSWKGQLLRGLSTSHVLFKNETQAKNHEHLNQTKNLKDVTVVREATRTQQSQSYTEHRLRLAAAPGTLARLRLRLRWLLKKLDRPFNTDDYSAFFSWIVISNVVLFFAATTTFVSIILFTANTVLAQEFVARKLGEFITKNSNLTVVFENAIVPGWSDGKISFQKCFVSRRPQRDQHFTKGSQSEAYAASLGLAEDDTDQETVGTIKNIGLAEPVHLHALSKNNSPSLEPHDGSKETPKAVREGARSDEHVHVDDGNYTQFDLTIEQVDITLSFNKWFNGTGIIDTLEMRGVRGVVDRTHVHWDPSDDATNYKNVHRVGDFEFSELSMSDVLFTLKQPGGFRPFQVAFYNCEVGRLRKHWLFYDFLNANVVSGLYDGALFLMHKRQRVDDFADDVAASPGANGQRVTQMRVNSLSVDHLNTGLDGPFGWITGGRVDMIGDVIVPDDTCNDESIGKWLANVAKLIKNEVDRYRKTLPNHSPPRNEPHASNDSLDASQYFVLDLTVRLIDVRAKVPFQAPELSYVNYALIRPIVAYINSKNTLIEIRNRIVKNIDDFAGSWTVYDSLLMDDIQAVVYENFVDYVADDEARLIRLRKVGFWLAQLFLQLLVISLGILT